MPRPQKRSSRIWNLNFQWQYGPAAILQAVINHAHAAALAIRSRSVARDLAAFHGEFGVTLNMHSAGRGTIPEFSALVIRDLAARHLVRGF